PGALRVLDGRVQVASAEAAIIVALTRPSGASLRPGFTVRSFFRGRTRHDQPHRGGGGEGEGNTGAGEDQHPSGWAEDLRPGRGLLGLLLRNGPGRGRRRGRGRRGRGGQGHRGPDEPALSGRRGGRLQG